MFQYPFKPGDGKLGKHRAKSKKIDLNFGNNSLTEKQFKILLFLNEHIDRLGFPPSLREAADYFSISIKAVQDYLKALDKKGYIKLTPGIARGLELLKKEIFNNAVSDTDMNQEMVFIAVLGRIAAGVPILAEENIEDHIALPRSLLPAKGNYFAVQVKGDSMQMAGILDQDIAIIQSMQNRKINIKNGDIIAVLIDGDATLKTYYRKGEIIELHPANDNYSVIQVSAKDNMIIAGRLAGIYRKY